MRWSEFYERVTEGLELRELWGQFKSEAQSSYQLYSGDIDWTSFEQLPRWKRFLRTAWVLFWAMLMHLSPSRRVVLLVSLLLVFLGATPVIVIGPGEAIANRPPFAIYGALGLLLLLALELADRVVMKRDLQIAREIQRWLVPSDPPAAAGVDIAFATRPANTVGGDYYDVVAQPAREGQSAHLLLVVADVAGKSVPAALLMATFQATLRALAPDHPALPELVRKMNESACARSQEGRRFTTAFFGALDLDSWEMRFINAGHNYPYVSRTDGSMERLSKGGLPLGISEDASYETGVVQLNQGDLLLLYTDGVEEAISETGEEFGDERLTELVRRLTPASAGSFLSELRQSVEQFVGQARQHDDMTWVVVITRREPRA